MPDAIPAWHTLCQNPQAIQRLYTTPPTLETVEIHAVTLQRDGPRLQLQLELTPFPDRPAPRWPPEANAVQMTLNLWGITEVALIGWGTTNQGAVILTADTDTHRRFRVTSPTLQLTGRFRAARIGSFTAYQRPVG